MVKDDVWELYKVDEDFSQSENLAAKNPAKLKELQAIFDKEAVRNHVYPIDDRRSERFVASIAREARGMTDVARNLIGQFDRDAGQRRAASPATTEASSTKPRSTLSDLPAIRRLA